MHDKDELVRRLHSAVEERLGPDAFLVDGQRLASNHVIYTSGLDPGVTVSVIAGGEG